MYNEVTYNSILYKIIKELAIGFRKKAYLAINTNSNNNVILFFPCVTIQYNDKSVNYEKFNNDIDLLENTSHGDKYNIIPIYTCKNTPIIITNILTYKSLYRYICEK